MEPPRDLPEPADGFDERLLADVRTLGWHCLSVDAAHHPEHSAANAALGPHAIYDAAFMYTVGLTLTRSHPELILVGRWQHAHRILATVVGLLDDGARFHAGDVSEEVLEDDPVRFGAVSRERRLELLTYADWLNRRRPFEALQLVLPDRAGRWPDQAGYDSYPQPMLADTGG